MNVKALALLVSIVMIGVTAAAIYPQQQYSKSGVDVNSCYTDGSCDNDGNPYDGLAVFKEGKEVDYIDITVWIQPVYEGVATRWTISGDLNARVDYVPEPKKSWPITAGTTSPPGNMGLQLVTNVRLTPAIIESWGLTVGEHRISFCATPDVTLFNDNTGEQSTIIEGAGPCTAFVFNLTAGSDLSGLKLVSVYLEIHDATYTKSTCTTYYLC